MDPTSYTQDELLGEAVTNDDVEEVRRLLTAQSNFDPDEIINDFDVAAENNNLDIISLLLDYIERHKPKLDFNDLKYTALEIAVKNGYLELAQVLLDAGVQFEDENDTLLREASSHDNPEQLEIVKLLIKYGAKVDLEYDNNAFFKAVENNVHSLIKFYLEEMKIPVNLQQGQAIYLASMYSDVKTLRILLESGADVKIRKNYPIAIVTARHVGYSLLKPKVREAQLLLKFGADPNQIAPIFYVSPSAILLGLKYRANNIPKEKLEIIDLYLDHLTQYLIREMSLIILEYL